MTPKTLSHIYKVGIQTILTYGCSAVNIDHKSVKCMDRIQGMLIKTALGLPKNRRNSPLLAAFGIEKIEQLIKRQQLSLLRNSLISNSKARTFYIEMMRTHHKGNKDVKEWYEVPCQRPFGGRGTPLPQLSLYQRHESPCLQEL